MIRLVFAHYFGGSARSWVPLVDAVGSAARCLAPDLPGFGGTAPPPRPSLAGYADGLIATAGDAPWFAVGHSMGGKIALAAATRQPAGLRGLILIAPSPPTPEPMADRAAALAGWGSPDYARQQVAKVGGRLPPDVVETAIADQLRVAAPAWRWWLDVGSRDDIAAATGRLDLPVLVLAGDGDPVMGLAVHRAVAAGLRRAELHVVAASGHLLPLERPRALAERIAAFVRS